MPQLFRKLTGIILLIAYCFANLGCATLFNSVNFKNAPRDSFVKIEVLTDENISTGSGVIIHHLDNLNTLILTAGHICKPNTVAMRILDLYENAFFIEEIQQSPFYQQACKHQCYSIVWVADPIAEPLK